jgi:hypothetical protein
MEKVIKFLESQVSQLKLVKLTTNHPQQKIAEEGLPEFEKAVKILKQANESKTSNERVVCDDYPEKKVPKNMGYGKGGEMVYI